MVDKSVNKYIITKEKVQPMKLDFSFIAAFQPLSVLLNHQYK